MDRFLNGRQFAQEPGAPERLINCGLTSRRFAACSVLLVILWSLIETALELTQTSDGSPAVVVVLSTVAIVTMGSLALFQLRWAKQVFLFICALSILAIAPALCFELTARPAGFFYSLIECAVKAAAFVAIVLERDAGGQRGS
jgi:hypothetical protein